MLVRVMAIALALSAPIFASQTVFNAPTVNNSFAPLGNLDVLAESSFTTFAHPAFPNYSVRIKKSDFCDGTVAEARHLFFYFFESRNDPDTDDVVFWTNGGPGCSSAVGLFMELGPCRVNNATKGTEYHPESWNSNANVFFIDQPIGVGFSYADYGEYVTAQSTTEEAAQDIAAFVAIFFVHFSKFQGRGFHMAGESYGGRYIPAFAAAVYDQNAYLIEAGIPPINLTSIMIGNGMTDVPTMMTAWYNIQCSSASVAPVQTIQRVFRAYSCLSLTGFQDMRSHETKESCEDVFDVINCASAMDFCIESLRDPYVTMGLNTYDLTTRCDGVELCYSIMDTVVTFLNRKDIQSTLGVDPARAAYSSCSPEVMADFGRLSYDLMHGSTEYVAGLLERGVRALVYAGSYDFVCNWLGNDAWTRALEWSGRQAFAGTPLREWTTKDGAKAGKTRSAGGLTFATIYGAGHMAPYDKPKESLEMAQRWIAGKEL
ncbi:Carboxypeptidase [Mycena kentingensis (nom. inval.)]|nr:Carboxypeptidase [Mycena kentingensis (nom. inval.)]